MNVAMSERLRKEQSPADFCPDKKCLWRVVTTRGVKPCPKHMPGSYAAVTDFEAPHDDIASAEEMGNFGVQCERCGETDGHRPGCMDEDGPLT